MTQWSVIILRFIPLEQAKAQGLRLGALSQMTAFARCLI
jgi:hypothetical protein